MLSMYQRVLLNIYGNRGKQTISWYEVGFSAHHVNARGCRIIHRFILKLKPTYPSQFTPSTRCTSQKKKKHGTPLREH
jgi:hypothetical protein